MSRRERSGGEASASTRFISRRVPFGSSRAPSSANAVARFGSFSNHCRLELVHEPSSFWRRMSSAARSWRQSCLAPVGVGDFVELRRGERRRERVVVVEQARASPTPGFSFDAVVLADPVEHGLHARVVLGEAGVDEALEARRSSSSRSCAGRRWRCSASSLDGSTLSVGIT